MSDKYLPTTAYGNLDGKPSTPSPGVGLDGGARAREGDDTPISGKPHALPSKCPLCREQRELNCVRKLFGKLREVCRRCACAIDWRSER